MHLLLKSCGMVLQFWTRLLRDRSFSLIVSKLKTFFLYILFTSSWNFCNWNTSTCKYIYFTLMFRNINKYSDVEGYCPCDHNLWWIPRRCTIPQRIPLYLSSVPPLQVCPDLHYSWCRVAAGSLGWAVSGVARCTGPDCSGTGTFSAVLSHYSVWPPSQAPSSHPSPSVSQNECLLQFIPTLMFQIRFQFSSCTVTPKTNSKDCFYWSVLKIFRIGSF